MKLDKATVELLEALEDYSAGQIPSDILKSVFIAVPKKPGTTECDCIE